MSDFLKNLLNKEAKVNEIGPGIYSDVKLEAIDLSQHKNKNGEIIKKNTYCTFVRLNDNGTVKERKEIAWFNPDPSSDYVLDTYREQITQLIGILSCYYSQEDADALFDNEVFKDLTSIEEIAEQLKSKKTATELMKKTMITFFNALKDHIGLQSKSIRLMLVAGGTNGTYVQQPRFIPFTESLDIPISESKLKFTNEHLKAKAKYESSLEIEAKEQEEIKAKQGKENKNNSNVDIDI